MPRRKKSTSKKQSNILTYIAWILVFVVVIMGSMAVGYYLGYENSKKDALKKESSKEQKRLSVVKKLEDESAKKDELSVNNRLKEVLKKESKPADGTDAIKPAQESKPAKEDKPTKESKLSEEAKPAKVSKLVEATEEAAKEYEDASHEIDDAVLPKPPKREIVKSSARPKLAIIIDDVSVQSHVNAIKGLHLPITMSFLPPSKSRPNSHTLAAKEEFYMVHLPMEAQSFKAEEPLTLKIDDSQLKISQRIVELKTLFPRVGYINNHTGSKFTANEPAMDKLISTLKSQNITFVDSRTTGSSKASKVSKKYGLNYIGRDVFLDHQMDKPYILSQIKKAIEIAKIHGSAIAIGHPHANTILAINESKKLFADVELVLVEGL